MGDYSGLLLLAGFILTLITHAVMVGIWFGGLKTRQNDLRSEFVKFRDDAESNFVRKDEMNARVSAADKDHERYDRDIKDLWTRQNMILDSLIRKS